jgi:biopolymer transport protein ExbB
MVAFFKAGGNMMWPLLVCLIIGAAYIVERFISYTLASVSVKKFMAELKAGIREGGVDKGIEYCQSNRSPVARVIGAGIESYKKVGPHRDSVEEAMLHAGSTELAFLDRGLPVLAAVSTIAPIIGFLGTVWGMIHAFEAIAIAGEVEPTLVATGISEALITTAAGLSIAFPVVAFHVYFTSRSNSYTRMMDSAATELIGFLMEEKP